MMRVDNSREYVLKIDMTRTFEQILSFRFHLTLKMTKHVLIDSKYFLTIVKFISCYCNRLFVKVLCEYQKSFFLNKNKYQVKNEKLCNICRFSLLKTLFTHHPFCYADYLASLASSLHQNSDCMNVLS